MKGKHFIDLVARNVHYHIELLRNISILVGDSATGKSAFRKYVQEYLQLDGKVKFTIKASAPFRILNGSWFTDSSALCYTTNSIVIIDEDANYLRSEEFARYVLSSSNYFLIICRTPLRMLPYSYKSVYKLVTRFDADKYITENKEYFSNNITARISRIITEDSNSERDMMRACYKIVEESELNGNGTFLSRIVSSISNGIILVMADGAALGPYIEALKEAVDTYQGRLLIWAPESFEYLLLTSGIVYRGDVPSILSAPEEQIDSSLFSSWERFFTWLVIDIISQYPGHKYSKNSLNSWYLSAENIIKFKSVIPDEVKRVLE